jgi:hypothetical protein
MKIEVSNGELLDKLSILEIKVSKISETVKLNNINKELVILQEAAKSVLPMVPTLYSDLLRVNARLWDIEDHIRNLESNQQFDAGFVETARSVYHLNDERARIKREIDVITGSELLEEKSYQGY